MVPPPNCTAAYSLRVSVSILSKQVFMASPSDVAPEREIVREELDSFNREQGLAAGSYFVPVGWEEVTPGVGRPQELINEKLDECDYLILILGERWGTPPDNHGTFSSGTEEEFERARVNLGNPDSPMRNMLVLFKTIERGRLDDAGPQLQKVVDFRAKLETSKQILFGTFDSPESFAIRIRRAVLDWSGDHGSKVPRSIELDSTVVVSSLSEEDVLIDVVAEAERAANGGQLMQAERLYAHASRDGDPVALVEFAKFMRRTGRLQTAIELNDNVLTSPSVLLKSDANAVRLRATAIANIGLINRKLGRLEESRRMLTEAVTTAELLDSEIAPLCYALDNLAYTLERMNREQEAGALFERSARLRAENAGDSPSLESARSLVNFGRNLLRRGLLADAIENFDNALVLLESTPEDPQLRANALTGRGQALAQVGRLEEAEDAFERALALNRAIDNVDGIAIVEGRLASLFLRRGDTEIAGRRAAASLEANQRSGNALGLVTSSNLVEAVQRQGS